MDNDEGDMNTALMVDGNAVAGQLEQIFGRDMTMTVARCAGCARLLSGHPHEVFGDGNQAHADCVECPEGFGRRRRCAEHDALVGLGLTPPGGARL